MLASIILEIFGIPFGEKREPISSQGWPNSHIVSPAFDVVLDCHSNKFANRDGFALCGLPQINNLLGKNGKQPLSQSVMSRCQRTAGLLGKVSGKFTGPSARELWFT
jgi:hypothetical protein